MCHYQRNNNAVVVSLKRNFLSFGWIEKKYWDYKLWKDLLFSYYYNRKGYKYLCKWLPHFSSCLLQTNMNMLMKSHAKVNYTCTEINVSWHDHLTIMIWMWCKYIWEFMWLIWWRNKRFFKNSLVLLVFIVPAKVEIIIPKSLEHIKRWWARQPYDRCIYAMVTCVLSSTYKLVFVRLFARIVKLRAQFQTMKLYW